MAQRISGRFLGAFTILAFVLPLSMAAGCKLFNKEKKQFGEDCTADTDCDSAECATYGSVCTKACTYDKDCGSGLVCRAREGGKSGDACAKPTGNATGQTCNTPAECQSGNCLHKTGQSDQPGICSNHCVSGDDCPAGFKICVALDDSNGTKFCIPGDPAAAITATADAPKFYAPRPVMTTTRTTGTTTTTTTTTAVASSTAQTPNLHGTSTAVASSTPSTTPTAKPTTSTRPGIVLKPVLTPKK
jgi:hypothetical protein